MSVFIRKIDELGRIVLPMEFRKALSVDTKCDIEMQIKDGSIVLTPHQSLCHNCGTIILSKTKYNLCKECLIAIKKDESIE